MLLVCTISKRELTVLNFQVVYIIGAVILYYLLNMHTDKKLLSDNSPPQNAGLNSIYMMENL
jgi:hypothetical protein